MSQPLTMGDAISRLVRAGLTTAIVDGVFASMLSVFAYHTPVIRLWQRVASTVLGPAAFDGGTRTMSIGLMMHVGVALTWSAVFLALYQLSDALRRQLTTTAGVIKVAVVYGPLIWIVMSRAVIPLFTGGAAPINVRWWVQLFGHIPFVAIPIVAMISRDPSE